MFIGLVPFCIVAIVVWFVLGMAKPDIALPPFLMKVMETANTKPTRKMVVQWTSIFMMVLFTVIVLIGALIKDTVVDQHIKAEITQTKSEFKNLLIIENVAIEKGQAKCIAITVTDLPKLKLLANQISIIEDMTESKETSNTITDILIRIRNMHFQLAEAGCVN